MCNIRGPLHLSSLPHAKHSEPGIEDMTMKPFAIQNVGGGEDYNSWEGLTPFRGESDYCSRDGAMALKAKIEAYWRERGQDVMIALHNVGFHPAIRAARYDVRSDMVNGMPRGAVKSTEPVHADVFEEFDDELVD
jgi:hypothetical protein